MPRCLDCGNRRRFTVKRTETREYVVGPSGEILMDLGTDGEVLPFGRMECYECGSANVEGGENIEE